MSFKIDIEFDDAELTRALNGLLSMGQDLSEMMDTIGQGVADSTKERFDTGLAPDGSPWKPSIRALAEGGKTLVKSGDLKTSFRHEVNGNEVVVGPTGASVIYAAIHQFGGKAGRNLASVIPARPFLGISQDDEIEISSVIGDFLREAADGR